MKLLFCLECHDVIRLLYLDKTRTCACGKSKGWYLEDGLHSVIEGPCVPLGFANEDFAGAIKCREKSNAKWGIEFKAFVIPKHCDTVVEREKQLPVIETVERKKGKKK